MKKSRWKSIQVHCLHPKWNWKQLLIFRQSVLFINLESLKNFRRSLADSRCPGSPLSARCRNTPSSMVTFSRFNNLKARSLKMPVGILLLWAVLPACTVTAWFLFCVWYSAFRRLSGYIFYCTYEIIHVHYTVHFDTCILFWFQMISNLKLWFESLWIPWVLLMQILRKSSKNTWYIVQYRATFNIQGTTPRLPITINCSHSFCSEKRARSSIVHSLWKYTNCDKLIWSLKCVGKVLVLFNS